MVKSETSAGAAEAVNITSVGGVLQEGEEAVGIGRPKVFLDVHTLPTPFTPSKEPAAVPWFMQPLDENNEHDESIKTTPSSIGTPFSTGSVMVSQKTTCSSKNGSTTSKGPLMPGGLNKLWDDTQVMSSHRRRRLDHSAAVEAATPTIAEAK